MRNHIYKAVTASLEAGKAILDVYQTDFSVEYKADDSPLTQADKKAHSIIKRRLLECHPCYPILSEEGRDIPFSERRNWEILWIVDPLDGTKEFVKRNGEFTVNVALVKGKRPVAGVIFSPVLDKLYVALEEEGALRIDNAYSYWAATPGSEEEKIVRLFKKAKILPDEKQDRNKSDTLCVVASRSHFSGETEEFVDSLKEKYGKVEIVSAGSSLKMCLVAEGKAQLYPRFAPTMEWDTAAGQAVVEASGGKVVQHDSEYALEYNKEDLVNPWFIVSGGE